MLPKLTVSKNSNILTLNGSLLSGDIFQFSKSLDIILNKQGYTDASLDFSQAYPVRESFMVPAIALIRKYRRNGVTFELIKPENPSGRSLFHNANWAHLIDDIEHAATTFDGDVHLPASVYTTSAEQTAAVDRVMSMILKALPLQRRQLAALEWSVSEVTDNVLNHAETPLGGVIQASTITVGGRQMVEFVVADTGIGIQKSLSETQEVRALERAIQEGVTRNPATNQGNGLYGTFRVSTLSAGRFELISGHASLLAEGIDRVRTDRRPGSLYPGTVVVCRVGCDDEKLIENALMFKGKVHQLGFDYIEKQYEAEDTGKFVFDMRKECSSFGSREAGIGARVLIENLLRAEPTYALMIDFTGVSIISSSFADEVFGRLFVALGPMAFMSRINFRNADSSIRAVLDRAISQRVSQSIEQRN
ncbi:STAS-like domain-containing protein [Ensifer adhaerens]